MKRKAVFIGVSHIRNREGSDLPNVLYDIRDLESFFDKRIGYQTYSANRECTTTRSAVLNALHDAASGLGRGDLLLVYFAGHGTTRAGVPYWECYDGPLSLRDVKREIYKAFDAVVVMDCCRADVYGSHNAMWRERDLAPLTASILNRDDGLSDVGLGSHAFIYACAEGCKALEHEGERHGAFSLAFLDVLRACQKRRGDVAVDTSFVNQISCRMKHYIGDVQEPGLSDVKGIAPILFRGKGSAIGHFLTAMCFSLGIAGAWMVVRDIPSSSDPNSIDANNCYAMAREFEHRRFFREANRSVALQWYECAAKNGCVDAQRDMGYICRDGELSHPIDEQAAYSWFLKASESGDTDALLRMGEMTFEGYAGRAPNEMQSLKFYEQAASNGCAEAQLWVGNGYANGWYGLNTNLIEAVRLWRLSASKGNVEAMGLLSDILATGADGIPMNIEESWSYLMRASNAGYARSYVVLGLKYALGDEKFKISVDERKALDYFEKAAKAGDLEAKSYLGVYYMYGLGGLKQNIVYGETLLREVDTADSWNVLGNVLSGMGGDDRMAEAFKCYSRSMEMGNDFASINLAPFYEYGLGGVPADPVKARQLYLKAALCGDTSGMIAVGRSYAYGLGGAVVDASKALEWFNKAAKLGNASGICHLGMAYEEGFGCVCNPTNAAACFLKAAHADDGYAQYKFGYYCQFGLGGVTPSISNAKIWYEKAIASEGILDAKVELGCILWNERDHVRARQLLGEAATEGNERAKKIISSMNSDALTIDDNFANAQYGNDELFYNRSRCVKFGGGDAARYQQRVTFSPERIIQNNKEVKCVEVHDSGSVVRGSEKIKRESIRRITTIRYEE